MNIIDGRLRYSGYVTLQQTSVCAINGVLRYKSNISAKSSTGEVSGILSYSGVIAARQQSTATIAGKLSFTGSFLGETQRSASINGRLRFKGSAQGQTYKNVMHGKLRFSGNLYAIQPNTGVISGILVYNSKVKLAQVVDNILPSFGSNRWC